MTTLSTRYFHFNPETKEHDMPESDTYHVRQSPNARDPKPYQVRRQGSDQTFYLVERFTSAAAAYARCDRLNRKEKP